MNAYPGLSEFSEELIKTQQQNHEIATTFMVLFLFFVAIFWLGTLASLLDRLGQKRPGKTRLTFGVVSLGIVVIILTMVESMGLFRIPCSFIGYHGVFRKNTTFDVYKQRLAEWDKKEWQEIAVPLDSALALTESNLKQLGVDPVLATLDQVSEIHFNAAPITLSGCRIVDKQLLLASATKAVTEGYMPSGGIFSSYNYVRLNERGDARPVLSDAQIALWVNYQGQRVTLLVPSKAWMANQMKSIVQKDWGRNDHRLTVMQKHLSNLNTEFNRITQNTSMSINSLWNTINDSTKSVVIDIKTFGPDSSGICNVEALRIRPASDTSQVAPEEMNFAGGFAVNLIDQTFSKYSQLAQDSSFAVPTEN